MESTNEEFEKQESNKNEEDSQKDQNVVSNEIMSTLNKTSIENNNIQSATVVNDVKGNNVLDRTTFFNSHVGDTELQSIISTEKVPMYNVNKLVMKVNRQEIESMKYDIVTTVKNKSHIDNEKV